MRTRFNIVAILIVILNIAGAIAALFVLYVLLTNPEAIGEWFGRLVSGFKSIQ